MTQANPITQAIKQICEEKNISYEAVIETIEAALAVAYRKDFVEKGENINVQVDFDPEAASARVFDVKTVVSDEFFEEAMKKLEAAKQAAEAAAAAAEAAKERGEEPPAPPEPVPAPTPTAEGEPPPEEERFDPKSQLPLAEAKKLKPDAKVGDEIRTELFPPTAYGRMAAQTAKQVIIQRLREAERQTIFDEYKGREGTLLNGIIQRAEGRLVLVDLGHTAAIMPPGEQIEREYYRPGTRMKFYVVSVGLTTRGPEIVISRSHPEMVRRLFEVEVPEIAAATVEIKAIAREAGSRTKIAVISHQKNVDPVGSCVGQRGTRVQTVISELGGEKIDIVEWSDDQVKYISNALSPAKVLSIKLDNDQRLATVEVKEDQVSLAIGKAGQNVRLAAKLTSWKIDIVGEEGTLRPSPDSPNAPKDGETAEGEAAAPAETEAPASAEPEASATAAVEKDTPAEAETPAEESGPAAADAPNPEPETPEPPKP